MGRDGAHSEAAPHLKVVGADGMGEKEAAKHGTDDDLIDCVVGMAEEGQHTNIAHAYIHNLKGDIVRDIFSELAERGLHDKIKVVFDGPAPACKKSWLDRSQVGSDSDPVRGSAARALRRQLGNEGVNVVLAPWEEDYYNVMQAANGAVHGLVQQDSDFFHPLLRLHLDGKPTTLLFKKLMSDGVRRWCRLDLEAWFRSLRLTNRENPPEELVKGLGRLYCEGMQAVMASDVGKAQRGVSASSLSASLQLILRDFGEGLLKLAKQGEEGKEQALQELAGHLNSKLLPGRAALKGKVCLEIAALSLVHSSGPAQGPAQGAHTLAIVPLLFPKARWMAALDTMFDPDEQRRQQMVQHLRERERQQELAQMQIYCTAVTDLLRDAHLRAEQQGLQLQLPAGCASLADVPPAAGQLREVWLHARGSAPDPSVAAGTVLMLVSRLSVEQCRQLVPEASPGALRSVLSGSSCQPIVRHLQQHHGAQELADAASQEAVARDVARLQRTEQQMRQVLAAAGGLLEAAGAAPELLEAVPLLQPSEEYLRTCGRMGPLPGAPTVACALLQLTGMTRREAAAALGLPEGTGTTASKHIANPKFREWAEPPLLQLGAVPSPELEALRHWAGQEDVTTGTERLGSDEKQLSDWASCKARLKETGCRELARLVNGGHLTLLEARLVAVSLALLPLPADWDSFTGSGRSRLSVGSVVGAAVATALPGKFTEVDAASLFGTGRGNVGRHSALLRLLPLLVAQAVEQLAEEEPEQQSQGQLVAARLRKAAGILAKAGAAQSSADDFWWLLGIVGLLCDYLGKEVDAGRLSEEVAAAAAQRGAALKPHAGAAAAPRKKNGNAIVAALLLYALSLASRAGGGGAGASGSGAGASSSGAGAAACPGSSNGAGSSSAARNNAAASAPLPYTAMTKAAAACGCSNISGMVEHSKPTSALRWVYDQLGVQPPSKSEQTKNSWAARKAAKGTGKKQGRKAGGAVGGGKAKKSKKA